MDNNDVLQHELDEYEGHPQDRETMVDALRATEMGGITDALMRRYVDDGKEHFPPKDTYKKLAIGGATPTQIEARHLEVGDILVSTGTELLSKTIKDHTKAPVSHAFMYVGGGKIIEADGKVAERSLADALANDYYAAAYRVPDLTDADRAGLVKFMRAQIGKPFDNWGVIDHLIYVVSEDPNAWYCSELVFAAYKSIGKPLMTSGKKVASAVDPDDSVPGHVLKINNIKYIGHVLVPAYARSTVSKAKSMAEEMALWGATPSDHRETMVDAMRATELGGITDAVMRRYVDDGKEHFPPKDSYKKLAIGGATPIQIEARHLEVGDILVSTGTELLSKTIKDHTKAPVSHAFMYIGGGMVIEADGTVSEHSLSDALDNDYYAAAYRVPDLTDADRKGLVKFMRAQVGKPFDNWGVIDHLIYVAAEDPNAWYCSELVFAAYKSIGKPLMISGKKTASSVDPDDSVPGHVLKISNIKYIGHVLVPAYARGAVSKAKAMAFGGRAMKAGSHGRRGQMLPAPPAASLAAVSGSPWR
ncbi:YiiX/YebB-like N1pC/P60 family cysteine hydrolase [uncultured Tateyamaria sp.]|uniref:YiiX/YebB-like N1pC/P60 family cysteine hydrolase n=1 Tax=Tateyamaria sp. 1078 TaxID=3417464 RepID=UPI002604ABF1|nr:YiiX/YebB-like N1pC/P60 family cysteine hydrolase [uncultured Tateyamaria sp.]